MAYYDPYRDPASYYGFAYPNVPGRQSPEWRDRIFLGEEVVGLYGDEVGTVKEIHERYFRVGRPFAPDVRLPYTSISDIENDQIRLTVPADQIRAGGGVYRPGYLNPSDWSQYGPYTGFGPRNYHRSDERIREDLNDRLWINGQLDASGIDVAVDDGLVTLNGTVDSRWAKRTADDIAWSVPGVEDVINNLKITRQSPWHIVRSQMHPGMNVVGSLGFVVGTVGEIRDYDFLLNRAGQPGLWVPFDGIMAVRNDRVILNVTREELDRQGWQTTNTLPA